jgi:hypothetical protein
MARPDQMPRYEVISGAEAGELRSVWIGCGYGVAVERFRQELSDLQADGWTVEGGWASLDNLAAAQAMRADEVRYVEIIHAPTPSVEEIEEWLAAGGCDALDGCWVEPDGECEHGEPSWARELGLL